MIQLLFLLVASSRAHILPRRGDVSVHVVVACAQLLRRGGLAATDELELRSLLREARLAAGRAFKVSVREGRLGLSRPEGLTLYAGRLNSTELPASIARLKAIERASRARSQWIAVHRAHGPVAIAGLINGLANDCAATEREVARHVRAPSPGMHARQMLRGLGGYGGAAVAAEAAILCGRFAASPVVAVVGSALASVVIHRYFLNLAIDANGYAFDVLSPGARAAWRERHVREAGLRTLIPSAEFGDFIHVAADVAAPDGVRRTLERAARESLVSTADVAAAIAYARDWPGAGAVLSLDQVGFVEEGQPVLSSIIRLSPRR